MMGHFYLEPTALVDWAVGRASAAPAPQQAASAGIDRLVHDPSASCAVAEVGLVEVHTSLCKYLMKTEPDFRAYDGPWMDACLEDVMTWLAAGHVQMLPHAPGLFETAMRHVTAATREHGRKFRSWDALHLAHAVWWARSIGSMVTVVTDDSAYATFLGLYPVFGRFVQLQSPSTL